MKLTLQTLTGTKYFLQVEPQDKVRKVKVKIFVDLDIKSKVRLLWQSKPLEDSVTLAGQGITEDATLQMVIEPDINIKLKIQTFKKGTISVKLEDSSTVLDLQKKIEASASCLLTHVSDFYFEDICLSEENLPFHLYGMVEGSVIMQNYGGSFSLEVEDPMENGFVKYITVQGEDTVKVLKEKILWIINNIVGEQEEETQLVNQDDIVIFHGHMVEGITVYDELDREMWNINECKIKPLDKITFIRYDGYYENYNTDDIGLRKQGLGMGRKMIKALYSPESVYSLKLKIQHQLQIPFEKQEISIRNMDIPLALQKKIYSYDKIDINIQCDYDL